MSEFWFEADGMPEEERWRKLMMWDGADVWIPLVFCGDEDIEIIEASWSGATLMEKLGHCYAPSSYIIKRLEDQGKWELSVRLSMGVENVKARGKILNPVTTKIDENGNAWFSCWWCRESLPQKGNLRHAIHVKHQNAVRACCWNCYNDPESNYRRIYGQEMTAEEEKRLVNSVS